jgi:metal-sulfur cluster biosynthetic enzyme
MKQKSGRSLENWLFYCRRSILDLNLVRGIDITDGNIKITIASTSMTQGAGWTKQQHDKAAASLSEVTRLRLIY